MTKGERCKVTSTALLSFSIQVPLSKSTGELKYQNESATNLEFPISNPS